MSKKIMSTIKYHSNMTKLTLATLMCALGVTFSFVVYNFYVGLIWVLAGLLFAYQIKVLQDGKKNYM